jgi:glycosyltransferase involved in cell wall biosynthesis
MDLSNLNPNRPIRVGLVMTRGMSLRRWQEAGLLERELTLYRVLAAKGVELHILSFGGREDCALAARFPFVAVHPAPFRMPALLYSLLMPLLQWRVLRPLDVIKTNQFPGAEAAVLAGFLHGVPVAVRYGYDYLANYAAVYPGRRVRLAAMRLIERLVVRRAAVVIATTAAIAAAIAERAGATPGRTVVIPNFVDTASFGPDGPIWDRPRRRRFRIGTVGRLTPEKNLTALIEAAAGLDVELVMVGDGSMRATLQEAAARHGVEIIFPGRLPHGDLPAVIRSLDVFAQPSLFEGHPKTLIEAMACGACVLATDVRGNRDVVRHGVDGYLAGTDADSLRQALQTLVTDPALRRRLGCEAATQARREFGLEGIATTELRLHRRLAEWRVHA